MPHKQYGLLFFVSRWSLFNRSLIFSIHETPLENVTRASIVKMVSSKCVKQQFEVNCPFMCIVSFIEASLFVFPVFTSCVIILRFLIRIVEDNFAQILAEILRRMIIVPIFI